MSAGADVLAVLDAKIASYEAAAELLTSPGNAAVIASDLRRRVQPLRDARDAVAELIAERDAMANALRKLDLTILPAAIRYRKIGLGNIEEAQEIVRAALARVGGAA